MYKDYPTVTFTESLLCSFLEFLHQILCNPTIRLGCATSFIFPGGGELGFPLWKKKKKQITVLLRTNDACFRSSLNQNNY